ncbi:MAG: AEC family transporter [Oscillospiraceae bacterium]|nr:AEC family transporter [Oscillospiraceae bacterium]MCD8376079.1 AEC family transporter [Oscillospiraceae bacterium]
MLSDLLIVVGQVLTLFLMMGVGFAFGKLRWFTEEASGQMTQLILYVVGPCIIITNLQLDASFQVVRTMLLAMLGMALTYIVMIPLSFLLFRKEPEDTRVVHRFGIIYANNSFMGLPLLAGVLGEDALLFGVLSMLVFSLFQWTHGVLTMGGKLSVKSAVLNPGIISIIIGVLFFAVGFEIPSPVYNAMDFMADLNTPLAMFIIGGQMSRADIGSLIKKPKLYLCAALKLILAPALTCVLLLPLNLSPLAYCAVVVLAACPTAGMTSMFSQRFHRDESTAAQMVTLSTLLSLLTLPVFAVLARTIAGLE